MLHRGGMAPRLTQNLAARSLRPSGGLTLAEGEGRSRRQTASHRLRPPSLISGLQEPALGKVCWPGGVVRVATARGLPPAPSKNQALVRESLFRYSDTNEDNQTNRSF